MKRMSGKLPLKRGTLSGRTLLLCWICGALVGTCLIALTSPLFLRSYLPLSADPVRGVWTLPPDSNYRWRSEGYADTAIGPLGMPGRTSDWGESRVLSAQRSQAAGKFPPSLQSQPSRIALWGDSQAEGVCVPDTAKLFAQIEKASGGETDVYPLARSGEDAADWLTQMRRIEKQLGIDQHVILVVEPSDLLAAVNAPVPPPSSADASAANAALAAKLPAFVIQAARNVLREPDGATPRRLRFGLGPVPTTADEIDNSDEGLEGQDGDRWLAALSAVRNATELPVTLLYAPLSPHIIDGKIRWQDPTSDEFLALRGTAEKLGIRVVDARAKLRDSVESDGRWPHGFHNGRIGSGHLNQVGNEILAAKLIDALFGLSGDSALPSARTLPSAGNGD